MMMMMMMIDGIYKYMYVYIYGKLRMIVLWESPMFELVVGTILEP